MEYRSAPLTASALKPDVLRITVTPFIKQLPRDAIGGSNKHQIAPAPLTLHWRDLTVEADLPTYAKSGGLRGFIRHRGTFTATLFEESAAEVDDVVVFEALGTHEFRLHVEKPDGTRVSGVAGPDPEEERARNWVLRETRPDQRKFRQGIIDRDGLICAISGCETPAVLEAAHLHPHADEGSSDPSNGVILRADIHRLFDEGLLTLDGRGRVTIDRTVTDTCYRDLDGLEMTTGADLNNLDRRAGR